MARRIACLLLSLSFFASCSSSTTRAKNGSSDSLDSGTADVSSEDDAADANVDVSQEPASMPDGGRDADADSTQDATNDRSDSRGTMDGGGDDSGFPFPFQGDWQPYPHVPKGCERTRIAVHPERDVPGFTYDPIAEKPGWAHFQSTWNAPGIRGDLPTLSHDPELIADHPRGQMLMVHDFTDGNHGSTALVIQPLHGGQPSFALVTEGTKDHCIIKGSVTQEGLGIGISKTGTSKDPSAYLQLSWYTWSNPKFVRSVSHGSQLGEFITNVFVFDSDTLMVQASTPPTDARGIYSLKPSEKSVIPVQFNTGYFPWFGRPTKVADGILGVDSYGGWGNLMLGKFDGSIEVLEKRTSLRKATDVTVDRTQNDKILWTTTTQQANDEPAVEELWESPYANIAANLKPRLVARVPYHYLEGFVSTRGHALFAARVHTAILLRVSDGKGWLLPIPSHLNYSSPLWIDDKYVYLMTTSKLTVPQRPDGILRIERATLGEPTIIDTDPEKWPE